MREGSNHKTAIGPGPWLFAAPPTFEEAFRQHYPILRATAERCGAPAYVIAGARRGDPRLQVCVLSSGGEGALGDAIVIGRHSRCAISLAEEHSAALRHVLLRLSSHVRGRSLLRVTDLNTGQGFAADRIGLCKAVTSDGPAYISIGAYGLLLLPSPDAGGRWPTSVDEAWAALASRRVFGEPHVHSALRDHMSLAVHSNVGDVEHVTHITVVPAPMRPRRLQLHAGLPHNSYARLSVIEERREAYFTVTAADLEAGVLLGRYSRCAVDVDDGGAHVSRVHLVLLKEGERVFAIDAASTNGTLVDRRPRALAELSDEATLELGKSCVVRWERSGRRAA